MSVSRLFMHAARLVFCPTAVVREKYAAFKDLLEHDHLAHKALARLESIYHDQLPVDFCAVKQTYLELVRSLTVMGRCLERMAPYAYRKLPYVLDSIDGGIRNLIEGGHKDHSAPLVVPLEAVPPEAHRLVGGKAGALSDLWLGLRLPVPKGFVITSRAFFEFLGHNRLQEAIDRKLAALDIDSPASVGALSREIISLILEAALPEPIEEAMRKSCSVLIGDKPCAVRSSAVGEDGLAVSFAGQYRTLLYVKPVDLPVAYKEVIASRYSPTALTYRIRNGLLDDETAMAVLVLEMVEARISGVLYTRDPMDLNSPHMLIYSTPGIGEPLVSGRSAPDIFHVGRTDALRVLKTKWAKGSPTGGDGVVRTDSDTARGPARTLEVSGARQLAAWGLELESYFGLPQDIEWCEDQNGNRFILQSRPLRANVPDREESTGTALDVTNPVLLSGGEKAASGVAMGRVVRLDSSNSPKEVPFGAILVAPSTLPQYARLLGRVKGVVTDTGSAAGHLASVARESGIPCLVNTGVGTQVLKDGETVTLDADRRVVYAGVAEELLALNDSRRAPPMETPFRKRLRKLLDAVSPLNLLDPDDPGFVSTNCRTLHDLLRFMHEKAVREMFNLSGNGKRQFRGARRLSADIPILLHVLDLGGALRDGLPRRSDVTPEEVSSFPFKALWRGLTSLPESWHPDVLHFDWGSLDRFSLGEGIVSANSQLLGSFALVAPDYLNLNIRFGLHFTVIDALIGPVSRNNYVCLHFKGGGAAYEGKHLRALFLAQVLESHGFSVQLDRDSVSAVVERSPAPVLEEKLEVIGRLLAFTPLLDMILKDLSEVSRLAAVFSKPPASSEPLVREFPLGEAGSHDGATPLRYRLNWLTEHLAVGHAPMSYGELQSIRSQGIGAIVNLCAEYPELAQIEKDFGFEVLYLPVPDDGAPEMEDMDRVLGWMDEAIYLGKKVLIHCRLGIGRTGTFLRSYLIRRGFGTELTEERLKRIHSHPTSRSQRRLLRRYGEQSGRLTVREPSLESERAVDLSLYFHEYESLCREADIARETLASAGSTEMPRCGRDTDACCTTPFHVQFMEAVYLWHYMVRELSREARRAVTHRAVTLNRALMARPPHREATLIEASGGPEGALTGRDTGSDYRCPLSTDDGCLAFDRRPIRCRLFIGDETSPPTIRQAHDMERLLRSTLTRETANETLHEMSRALFLALNGTFLEGRSLLFPITHVVSGKYLEDYFTAVREIAYSRVPS